MTITITNNTTLLNELKTKAESLPNREIAGVDVSGVTATASDVLSPKVFVDSTGVEQTGTIVTKTTNDLTVSGATVTIPAGYYASDTSKSVKTAIQAIPNIDISPTGLITANATQSAGYVSSGTKETTKQLHTKSATTYTPGTSNQTISSGYYLTGTQTIKGDSNLVSENIKSGVTIFNVAGTYGGSSSSYRHDQTGTYFAGTASSTTTITFNIAGIKDIPLAGFIVLPETTLSRPQLTGYSLIVSLTCMDGYVQGDTGDGGISITDRHKWEYTTIGRSTGITFSSDADSQFSYTRSGSTLTITSATTSIKFSTINGERYRLYPICANTVYADFEGIPIEVG